MIYRNEKENYYFITIILCVTVCVYIVVWCCTTNIPALYEKCFTQISYVFHEALTLMRIFGGNFKAEICKTNIALF